MGRSPNIGRILPQIAEICMLFSCLERCPWPPLEHKGLSLRPWS